MSVSACSSRWPQQWARSVGAFLTARISTEAIGIVFGITLLYSAWSAFRHHEDGTPSAPNALAEKLKLTGDYPVSGGRQAYIAQHVPAGFGIMFVAGLLSGLLGIGFRRRQGAGHG